MEGHTQVLRDGAHVHPPQSAAFVKITIDGNTVQIHRGHQTVAAIKTAGSVPLAYELEQVIDGKLTPLPDDGAVVIKGEEVFVSHARDAAAS